MSCDKKQPNFLQKLFEAEGSLSYIGRSVYKNDPNFNSSTKFNMTTRGLLISTFIIFSFLFILTIITLDYIRRVYKLDDIDNYKKNSIVIFCFIISFYVTYLVLFLFLIVSSSRKLYVLLSYQFFSLALSISFVGYFIYVFNKMYYKSFKENSIDIKGAFNIDKSNFDALIIIGIIISILIMFLILFLFGYFDFLTFTDLLTGAQKKVMNTDILNSCPTKLEINPDLKPIAKQAEATKVEAPQPTIFVPTVPVIPVAPVPTTKSITLTLS